MAMAKGLLLLLVTALTIDMGCSWYPSSTDESTTVTEESTTVTEESTTVTEESTTVTVPSTMIPSASDTTVTEASTGQASSTVSPDVCYSYSCHTADCLEEAIDDDTVTTCLRNNQFCKLIKTVKDNMYMTEAKCSMENCQFNQTITEQEGKVTSNCCASNQCNNPQLVLEGAATLLLPSLLPLSVVALLALMTSLA